MARERVLIELEAPQERAFDAFSAALESRTEAVDQAESMLEPFAGLDVDVGDALPPVPMFSAPAEAPTETFARLAAFASIETNPDMSSSTTVVSAEVDRRSLEELRGRPGVVTVWPDSRLTLFADVPPSEEDFSVFDLANSQAGVDCRPFRPAATIRTIRRLLGVDAIWRDGFRGQNIVVGIIDEGVNGTMYPVVGGFSRPGARQPGSADIGSHGSMCAADVLIAAPAAKLFDYPFLAEPRSGGALAMFNAVLEQRRRDGTPHLTNNSYGFTGVPPRDRFPNHEVWDSQHPLHRKVREVISSGAPASSRLGTAAPSAQAAIATQAALVRDVRSMPRTASPRSSPSQRSTVVTSESGIRLRGRGCLSSGNPISPATRTSSPTSALGARQAVTPRRSTTGRRRRRRSPLVSLPCS